MIAVARIVLDRFKTVKKPLVAIAEIQKRTIMYKELDSRLRSDSARGITVVPRRVSNANVSLVNPG